MYFSMQKTHLHIFVCRLFCCLFFYLFTFAPDSAYARDMGVRSGATSQTTFGTVPIALCNTAGESSLEAHVARIVDGDTLIVKDGPEI